MSKLKEFANRVLAKLDYENWRDWVANNLKKEQVVEFMKRMDRKFLQEWEKEHDYFQ